MSFRVFVEADQPQPYGADYAYCSEYCHSYIFVAPWGGVFAFIVIRFYGWVYIGIGGETLPLGTCRPLCVSAWCYLSFSLSIATIA
jgi:hypothetical protein